MWQSAINLSFVLGLLGKAGGQEGHFRSGFHEKAECLAEPMPAGSKMDPSLVQVKPTSNGGGVYGIMNLGMAEKAQ